LSSEKLSQDGIPGNNKSVFNWSMEEQGVKMPSDINPVSKVSKYKEKAPEVRF
jgi:hypothetical protein